MRGKDFWHYADNYATGITPAYAGKSGISPGYLLSYRDHPRVCGEKESVNDGTAIRAGSPPRMRGKARSCQANTSVTRITPAYAGKSSNVPSAFRCGRDHPRVCGEKAFVRSCCASRTGSPPRMRGKVCTYSATEHGYGITPAYAGKCRPDPEPDAGTGDHPRVCGEKLIPPLLGFGFTGSPPRMRGKDTYGEGKAKISGITPAYAGKRLKRSRSTVPPVAIVPLFPSVCNKPVVSDGSPAGRDAPLFLPAENAVPASPAYNLRSL